MTHFILKKNVNTLFRTLPQDLHDAFQIDDKRLSGGVQQSSDILSITKEQIALQIRDKNLTHYFKNQHSAIKKGQGKETYLSTDSMQYLTQFIQCLKPSENITIHPTITECSHYSICGEDYIMSKTRLLYIFAKPWIIDNSNRSRILCTGQVERIFECTFTMQDKEQTNKLVLLDIKWCTECKNATIYPWKELSTRCPPTVYFSLLPLLSVFSRGCALKCDSKTFVLPLDCPLHDEQIEMLEKAYI
jgi:hypothetical protein